MTIYNFTMLNVPFANGAISTEIAPFPDWNRGLGIAFEQTEGKPEMKGLNGLFQVLTTSMLYLKQRGIAEWDAALEYPVNAFVTEGAKLYKSKRTNTAKQPSLSQLHWDVWASIADISVGTNGNLKKTTAAGGGVTLEVPTASDSQRGAVRFATATEAANRSNVQAAARPSDVPALNNTLSSTSTTQALTAAQGKKLQDEKLDKSGGTVTGAVTVSGAGRLINLGSANTNSIRTRGVQGIKTDNSAPDGLYLNQEGGAVYFGVNQFSINDNGDFSGNAATATKLATSRTINGVAFDGTANINIPTATTSTVGTVRQATSAEIANRSNVNAYINPANVGQTFGASLSTNGWCRLPNGLILQWGVLSNVALNQTFHQVSFPIAFPTKVLNISATISATNIVGGSIAPMIRKGFTTNTSFHVAGDNSTDTTVGDIYWFTIGY